MKTEIDRFSQVIYSKFGDLENIFNPPCNNSDIRNAEVAIGHTLPKDLKEMYQWANGMNDSEQEECDIFDGFVFLSLHKAVEMSIHPEKSQMFADQYRFNGASDIDISKFMSEHDVKDLFCVLMDYDGKEMWIDLEDGNESSVYIRLRDRIGFIGKPEPLLSVFDNLKSMLMSLTQCHENDYFNLGAYSYHENRSNIIRVMNLHNPNSSNYWNGWSI
ncbi:SMI1/KNR4 family protein [Armatimonas sp.]|uniref:SMI1/KNR4 family protein n=1 Tax=Armatimonas sp. TaxID=1872638 RepID=UPI003750C32D